MPTKVAADSEWFILPMKWYNQWEKHCYSDLILDQANDQPLEESERSSPGKIDFSEVFQKPDDT